MVTHQLQVRCRPVKVRRSETDVLSLSYPTNHVTQIWWWWRRWLYTRNNIHLKAPLYPHRTLWRYTNVVLLLLLLYTTTVVTVAYEYLKFQNLTIAIHREVTDQTKTSARDVTTMTWAAEHSRCDVADDRLTAGHKRRPLGAEKMWRQQSSLAAHTSWLTIHRM